MPNNQDIKGKQKASESDQTEQNEVQFASSSSSLSTQESIQFTAEELARIEKENSLFASSSSSSITYDKVASALLETGKFSQSCVLERGETLRNVGGAIRIVTSVIPVFSAFISGEIAYDYGVEKTIKTITEIFPDLVREHQTQLILRNKQLATDLVIADRKAKNLEAEKINLERDNLTVGNINVTLSEKLKEALEKAERQDEVIRRLNTRPIQKPIQIRVSSNQPSSSNTPIMETYLDPDIEIQRLNIELESANAKLKISNQTINGLKHENSLLRNDNIDRTNELNELTAQIEISLQGAQRLREEIAQLKTQIRTLESEKTQLQAKFERAKRRGTVGLAASTSQGLIKFLPESWMSKEAKEATNTAIQAWSVSELVLSTADWTYEWIILVLGMLLVPFFVWLRKRIFGWKEINKLEEKEKDYQNLKEKFDSLKDEKKELKEKNEDLTQENDKLKENLRKNKPSTSKENETNST